MQVLIWIVGLIAYGLNFLLSYIEAPMLWLIHFIAKDASSGVLQGIATDWIPVDSKKYGSLMTMAETIFNLLSPIGCGLVIVFFFLELINLLAKDNLSGYALLKTGVQLIFAFGIISYGFDLCIAISGIGTWFANQISFTESDLTAPSVSCFLLGDDFVNSIKSVLTGTTSEGATNIDEALREADAGGSLSAIAGALHKVETSNEKTGAFGAISSFLGIFDKLTAASESAVSTLLVLAVLFPLCLIGIILVILYWAAMQIVKLILILQCVSRAIQVAVYAAMAPIGIAAWFTGGSITSSTAMRYVKKLLALSIQGGIMLLILKMAWSISAGSGSLVMALVCPMTAVGMFGKSNQIANDVCGT